MKNNEKNLTIFSDVHYSGYQHVNQMLFRHSLENEYQAFFISRFYMNLPRLNILKRLIKRLFSRKAKINDDAEVVPNIRSVINFPPTNTIFDSLTSSIIKKQLPSINGFAITFVPSLVLEPIFSDFDKLAYYCVHDSSQQSYSRFNLKYEEKLVERSSIVFCDNEKVIRKLGAKDIVDISTESDEELLISLVSGNKFFLVPPPVPEEFFSVHSNIEKKYDFCYFGSIHKDIDQDYIKAVAEMNYKVLIISNEMLSFTHDNIYCKPATSNLTELVKILNQSERFLLPYKNSEFMKTISPAKIYQCLAMKKPIYCSNDFISESFDLNSLVTQRNLTDKISKLTDKSSLISANELFRKVTLLLEQC